MPQVRGHHDTGVGVELRGFAPIGLRPGWSDGVMEYWNQDTLFAAHYSITPPLQYSATHCLPNSRRMRKSCCLPQLLDTPVGGLAAFPVLGFVPQPNVYDKLGFFENRGAKPNIMAEVKTKPCLS